MTLTSYYKTPLRASSDLYRALIVLQYTELSLFSFSLLLYLELVSVILLRGRGLFSFLSRETEKARRGGREELNGIWEEEERERERESVRD